MKRKLLSCCLMLWYSLLLGQSFVDQAAQFNISETYLWEEMGAGVSFCDFNGDGWDDLTISSESGAMIHFYQNNQGQLEPIQPLIPLAAQSKQVLWADYDNDGDKDLFVAVYEGFEHLYENDGNLNFTEVGLAAGIGGEEMAPTIGAAFGDVNNDGWLDLYVCNLSYEGSFYPNYLYLNQGDGTFLEIGATVGADDGYRPSFCPMFFDYNHDGHQDIYIAQDKYYEGNTLFKNLGNGQFVDVGPEINAAVAIDAMNAGGADYDQDGDIDLYITNTPEGNVLLRNDFMETGEEGFTDVTDAAGVGFYRIGWAANFLDFDNDLDLDLYVSSLSDQLNAPNALYINQGDATFKEPLFESGGLQGHDFGYSFSNTFGDYNMDGRLDIIVANNFPHKHQLWENQTANDNNWIKIQLEGTVSNRDGIGSWIEVYVGGEKYVQYTHCGLGWLGQSSANTHFGLGSFEKVDTLVVKWLSRAVDIFYDVPANQLIQITELEGLTTQVHSAELPKQSFAIQEIWPNPLEGDQLSVAIEVMERQEVVIDLMNTQGQIRASKRMELIPGRQTINWSIDREEVPPGVYAITFQIGARQEVRKVLIL